MCDISRCGPRTLLLCGIGIRGPIPVQRVFGRTGVPRRHLFTGSIKDALASEAFRKVTGRRVEAIDLKRCAVRGAPLLRFAVPG